MQYVCASCLHTCTSIIIIIIIRYLVYVEVRCILGWKLPRDDSWRANHPVSTTTTATIILMSNFCRYLLHRSMFLYHRGIYLRLVDNQTITTDALVPHYRWINCFFPTYCFTCDMRFLIVGRGTSNALESAPSTCRTTRSQYVHCDTQALLSRAARLVTAIMCIVTSAVYHNCDVTEQIAAIVGPAPVFVILRHRTLHFTDSPPQTYRCDWTIGL